MIGACMEDFDATSDNSDTSRSWNISLGMTHVHGSFGVRLEIFCRD